MKLSISNIAWKAQNDEKVYELMRKYGFSGLEVAPTRFFQESPYDQIPEATELAEKIRENEGFVIPSMQSIWYGRNEHLFGKSEEREILLTYTKKAIDWAEATGCKNLVFGCPRNRQLPDDADESVAVDFFKTLGEYALEHKSLLGMEANPPIYNTNYVNTTTEAVRLIEKIDSEGFRLNLDIGTMLQNGEEVEILIGKGHLISHVHISEPGLKPIAKREIHQKIRKILEEEKYSGFVSIEMATCEDLIEIERAMDYVAEVFG